MNKVNEKVLKFTQDMMEKSDQLSSAGKNHTHSILNAPVSVKRKRSNMSIGVGSVCIVIGLVLLLIKGYSWGRELMIIGGCTVLSNLWLLNKYRNA